MNSRVRAIIINQNKILLIKRIKSNKTYWVFPGGGVELGEIKQDALIREIKEELGLDIKVEDLVLEKMSDKPGMKQCKEYFFIAEVIDGELGTGKGPEYDPNSNYKGSYELKWVNITDLSKVDLKPVKVRDLVIARMSE